jgi:hypothetical protein
MENVVLGQVLVLVLPFVPFNFIPPVLHIHLQLRVFLTRTKRRNPANAAKSNAVSNIEEQWIGKNLHVIITIAKPRVRSLVSPCEILVDKLVPEQVFLRILRFSPAIVISAILHTRPHSHVTLNRWTTGSLGTFQIVVLFCKSGSVC